MLTARIRLACLWLSQVARITADNSLRILLVLHLAEAGTAQREAAWHWVATLFVLPAVFLAPLNGALCNSLPKRRVLIGCAAFCLGVVLCFSLLNQWWLWCLALVAIGNAIYSPTRYALLPAAARDAQLPLARVNGWIEMGAVSAIVLGILLGGYLYVPDLEVSRLPARAVMTLLVLNLVSLAAAVPVIFPADVRRAEPAGQALLGFFRDSRRIFQSGESRACLLALACLRGFVLAASGALVAAYLSSKQADQTTVATWEILVPILLGAALGSLLAGIQGHPTRSLGLVPFGVTGLFFALVWAALVQEVPWWLYLTVGVMGGLINVPLFATYQASLPADARGNGIAVLNTAGYICMAILSLFLSGLASWQIIGYAGQLWFLVVLAGCGSAFAWRALVRDSYDQTVEFLFWPIFRVRGYGPGLDSIPRQGPLLLLANHASWFDPVFLAKVLPRRITGMLTSTFYDLPVLHFLAKYVVQAIRVEASTYRREVPEIDQAVAALDRGEAVLIFPEGQMRKRDEPMLHRFGRGIWHILKERPATPVVVCWIEGAWGSYTSYAGGAPTKNKRPDFWRRIQVVVSAPEVLDAAVLDDHHATRRYCMKKCLEARSHLGLDVPLTTHL